MKNLKERFLELAVRRATMPDTVANKMLMRKIDRILDEYNRSKKDDANSQ